MKAVLARFSSRKFLVAVAAVAAAVQAHDYTTGAAVAAAYIAAQAHVDAKTQARVVADAANVAEVVKVASGDPRFK